MAAVTHWINTDDIRQVRALNPHARIGIPLAQDNKNMVIHATDESFPWRGTVLAVQIIRLCSLLMGAGTVWCTYCLARLVLPDRPIMALGAMALNAFNPMFVFISASVNNDNLIILLASLILLALVRLLQRGGSHRSLLVIGALVGLACLSKLSGLALIPLAMGALALRRWGELDRLSISQHHACLASMDLRMFASRTARNSDC
jgi:predicted membrane-bound mannosyltransferase